MRMRLNSLVNQLRYLIVDNRLEQARRYNIITQVFCLNHTHATHNEVYFCFLILFISLNVSEIIGLI